MEGRALSRLMSLVLRHRPDEFGLVLDPEGFVPIDDLVAAWKSRRHLRLTRADVEDVVANHDPHKQRFSIIDGQVRANYGHSLPGRIEHAVSVPPAVLWHGTDETAADVILADGLRPMERQYVHLTTDVDLARAVGSRRGRPVVLVVDAARAEAEGIVFRRANEHFWLVDAVPATFLQPSA